jgi:hypothetical protein
MLFQGRSAPSTGHWLGSPVLAKALHPPLYQRDLLCVSVPEGMARPGRPPRPSRRSLDRNPPKPGWADLFSKITIGIFVEARIVE